jgi:hypothetical protein
MVGAVHEGNTNIHIGVAFKSLPPWPQFPFSTAGGIWGNDATDDLVRNSNHHPRGAVRCRSSSAELNGPPGLLLVFAWGWYLPCWSPFRALGYVVVYIDAEFGFIFSRRLRCGSGPCPERIIHWSRSFRVMWRVGSYLQEAVVGVVSSLRSPGYWARGKGLDGRRRRQLLSRGWGSFHDK